MIFGVHLISKARNSSFIACLALWIVSTAIILGIRTQPTKTPLFEDEIYWIGSSYYYDLAFVRHDWTNPDWLLLPAQENPPVAKYVIGLSLAAAGQHINSPDLLGSFYVMFSGIPGAWGDGEDFRKRLAVADRVNPILRERVRTAPRISLDPELLIPARVAMIVCVSLTSLLVFLFAQTLAGKFASLVASQALLLHPIAIEAYSYATSDAVAVLFSTAAAIALFRCISSLNEISSNRAVIARTSIVAGFWLALACGAKMNSLVVLALAGATFIAVILGAVSPFERKIFFNATWAGSGVFGSALVFFIGLNPALYKNVIGSLAATVTEHRRTEMIQLTFLSGRLDSLPAKVNGVGEVLAVGPFLWIPLALFAIGCLTSSRAAVRYVAAWWLIAYVCVTLWIPFLRVRYVAPLLVPSILVFAILVDFACHSMLPFLRYPQSSRRAASKPIPTPNSATVDCDCLELVDRRPSYS